MVDAGQHGRWEEVAGARNGPAPREDLGSERNGLIDEFGNLPLGRRVDERPHSDAGVRAPPHSQRSHAVRKSSPELLEHRLVHVEPVGSGARLSHVAHLGGKGPAHRLVEVSVLEDDERGVATQLHGRAQHALRALLEQDLADPGRPGEGELARQS